jgi:hypothetical protein
VALLTLRPTAPVAGVGDPVTELRWYAVLQWSLPMGRSCRRWTPC